MIKEEQVLFPYICELAARDESCERRPSPFGTVENPILMMEREHRAAAEDLRTIRELTDNYTPPADGCTTYAVCLAEAGALRGRPAPPRPPREQRVVPRGAGARTLKKGIGDWGLGIGDWSGWWMADGE